MNQYFTYEYRLSNERIGPINYILLGIIFVTTLSLAILTAVAGI